MGNALTASGQELEVAGIRRGWLLALGVALVAMGLIGLGMTYRLTTIAIFWIGVLAFIAGVGQLLDAFHHKGWGGLMWHVIIGLLYLAIGLALTLMPVKSAYWLTMLIGVGFALAGLMRLLIMFQFRGYRGLQLLLLVSGLIGLGMAAYVFRILALPEGEALSTAVANPDWARQWGWIIGLFIALELIMEGISQILIATTGRSFRQVRLA
ncbi:HdeD family acid-resistance protein [Sphingomonas daechungensis]